jgi:hypothetical protein
MSPEPPRPQAGEPATHGDQAESPSDEGVHRATVGGQPDPPSWAKPLDSGPLGITVT